MHDHPSGLDRVLAEAFAHHQAGRLNDADILYRQVLDQAPDHADARHLLGVSLLQRGEHDRAIAEIATAIRANAGVALYHHHHGLALAGAGRWEDASAAFRQALRLRPDHPEALFQLGRASQALGRTDEATASYLRATLLKPDFADAHTNLASLCLSEGRAEDAAAGYRRALELNPDLAPAHLGLAMALQRLGRMDEAMAAARNAATRSPENADAFIFLGGLLRDQNRLMEAAGAFRNAIAARPTSVPAWLGLGNALRKSPYLADAHAAYGKAIELDPDCAAARVHRALSTLPIYVETEAEGDRVLTALDHALDDLSAWGLAHPAVLGPTVGCDYPFLVAYRRGNARSILAKFGALSATTAQAYWQRPQPSPPPGRARIRLVAIAGQIYRQSVWDVILRGIVKHLDRARFEIILYHTGALTDAETAWAATQVDRFEQGPKTAGQWLELIDRDRPDIVFYPEVAMDPMARTLAALRLAPLQMASWGHPITTGFPTLDLFLSGELLEAPDADSHYSETLIRLPGTGVCTERIALATEAVDPARLGLSEDRSIIRFLLCQAPFKFDPADDALYVRIAQGAGPCQFWLSHEQPISWGSEKVLDRLGKAFAAAGLDPAHYVRRVPWLPRQQFFGLLDEMDIYLDCPAFSGYTTAWQATHQGIPIVTLEGEFLRQRLAAGLLRQIGRTDTIAQTADAYVATTLALVTECRQGAPHQARRALNRANAPKADGTVAVIRALERHLIAAVTERQKAAPADRSD